VPACAGMNSSFDTNARFQNLVVLATRFRRGLLRGLGAVKCDGTAHPGTGQAASTANAASGMRSIKRNNVRAVPIGAARPASQSRTVAA
jgi:hypothetical protein